MSSIDLVWRGTGGLTTITVTNAAPVELVADIVLRVDLGAEPVSAVGVSVVIDEDSQNELNFVSAQENNPAGIFTPLAPGVFIFESPFGGPALLEGFDQASLNFSQAGGTSVTLGSITFQTNPGQVTYVDPTADVRVFVSGNGLDGIVDGSGNRCIGELQRNDCPYAFGELRVVPEPTTAGLIIAGLGIGLFYSRRR